MSSVANKTWTETGGETFAAVEAASASPVNCFHCGERCIDDTFARAGKNFCCNGCRIVHDLLAENGLEHFYALTEHPGVRVRGAQRREQWLYLDEPALQRRLLDFTDGKTSRVTLHIPAIHCVACVWLLENLFRLHPGVASSVVNFPRREVAIVFAAEKIKFSQLVALLVSIGYEPALTLNELEEKKADPAVKRRWLQIGLAGFAFGNIMLFSLPRYFGLDRFSGPMFGKLFGALSLLLALPVVIYSASDYWKSTLLALRQRVLTLDVPITVGLAAIYGQSAYEILSGAGEGYCDSLTGLIFFLLCGRAFQQKTHERIAFDRDYRSFFPLSATRKTRAGEESISISEIKTGDRVVIRNGELIPADAILINGAAQIDYSFVTGESEPVAKNAGDYLYAGGKQTGGAIEVETVKAVSQSYLISLWNHETFQKKRDDDLNSLTNRYSRRFTRIVIGVAVLAAVFWLASGNLPRALKAFTSVLIVACPCALALAAPFTLGTAQRVLSKIGVFVKNALVLERLSHVDAIVFDKTGTLTAAHATNEPFRGAPLNELEKLLLSSLARHSTHPYSRKIYDAFRNGHALKSVASFAEKPGLGVEGRVDGHEILIGSQKWFATRGIEIKSPAAGVCLAIDGNFRGTFSFANELRPQTDRLIGDLGRDFELALLSGDHERERGQFRDLFGPAAKLNFNQTPLDKLGFIQRLQESGKTVMMVGDGLNDAGALKQSDVGVAVVEKIGAFSPASDVILEASQVRNLGGIISLARKSARIVRVSFGISAAYNLIGVSIAASGLLSPLTCAVLMPVSSVSVVLFACGATTWAAQRSGLGGEA